jgi:polyisoprenoid-binding protein YceI
MSDQSVVPSVNPIDLLGSGAAAGDWELEPIASKAEFAVKHFWGRMTVKGGFERLIGSAQVDATGAVRANLEIEAASLKSHNANRDSHLRSKDFFNVVEYPKVTFASREVSVLGKDRLRIVGDLTAAGRSQAIEFEAQLAVASPDHVDVDATLSVDRTQFGMTWSPLRIAAPTASLSLHLCYKRSKQG